MGQIKETITTKQDESIDSTGGRFMQETQSVNRSSSDDIRLVVTNIVWFIVGVIEVVLALRFILKLLGANPNSGFVDFIYSVSGVLTAPFDNIFRVTQPIPGDIHGVFEPSILVAALVYALIGWGILKLINLNHSV